MTPSQARDWLWYTGWAKLADLYGWDETKARKAVGKLLKAAGEPCLAQRAVQGILDKQPLDPIPWAIAGIKRIHEKTAERHRPGFRPQANLPPVVPVAERVKPERFAELREMLEAEK